MSTKFIGIKLFQKPQSQCTFQTRYVNRIEA